MATLNSGEGGTAMYQPNNHLNTIHLPAEILGLIFGYLTFSENHQAVLYSVCLVSRQWYKAAIAMLYAHPILDRDNCTPFLRCIGPSSTPSSDLADLVRTLDLSRIRFKHPTAIPRILNRVAGQLVSFVAPRGPLMTQSFPAISRCRRLRKLDMSRVSETISLRQFVRLLTKLPELVEVRFPRFCTKSPSIDNLPMKWTSLHLGQRSWVVCRRLTEVWANGPPPITTLCLDNVMPKHPREMGDLIACLSPRLLNLSLAATLQETDRIMTWDFLLHICKVLQKLSIPAVLIGRHFMTPYAHPLEVLELTSVGLRIDYLGLRRLDVVNNSKKSLKNLKELRLSKDLLPWDKVQFMIDRLERKLPAQTSGGGGQRLRVTTFPG